MVSQPSFDKQFVRDYFETLDWDKTPPAPELPEEIVLKTRFNCSQLERTEASELSGERRYEFCLNKCLSIKGENARWAVNRNKRLKMQ